MARTIWEYNTATFRFPLTKKELDVIGRDMWELVSCAWITPVNEINEGSLLYIFKRSLL